MRSLHVQSEEGWQTAAEGITDITQRGRNMEEEQEDGEACETQTISVAFKEEPLFLYIVLWIC